MFVKTLQTLNVTPKNISIWMEPKVLNGPAYHLYLTLYSIIGLFYDFESIQGRAFQIWTNDNNIKVPYV